MSSSHLSSGRLNIGLIQEQARKQLLCLLEKCDGPKVPKFYSLFTQKLLSFLQLEFCFSYCRLLSGMNPLEGQWALWQNMKHYRNMKL